MLPPSAPVSCASSLSPLRYLLEVDELGLVRVEVEARAVVADGVPADGGRRVFELLGDVFDQPLAVHAQEGSAHLRPQRRAEQSSDKFRHCCFYQSGSHRTGYFHACAGMQDIVPVQGGPGASSPPDRWSSPGCRCAWTTAHGSCVTHRKRGRIWYTARALHFKLITQTTRKGCVMRLTCAWWADPPGPRRTLCWGERSHDPERSCAPPDRGRGKLWKQNPSGQSTAVGLWPLMHRHRSCNVHTYTYYVSSGKL